MSRTCWNGPHPLPTDRSNLLHNIGGGRFVCCPCWCQGERPCRPTESAPNEGKG